MAASTRNPFYPTARSRGDCASFLRLTHSWGSRNLDCSAPTARTPTCTGSGYAIGLSASANGSIACGWIASGVAAKSALTKLAFSWKNVRRQLKNDVLRGRCEGGLVLERVDLRAQSAQGIKWPRIQDARSSSEKEPSAKPVSALTVSVSGASSSKPLTARNV